MAPTGGAEVNVIVCTIAPATVTSWTASDSNGTVGVSYWWAWIRHVPPAMNVTVAPEIVQTALEMASIEKWTSRPAELVAVTT